MLIYPNIFARGTIASRSAHFREVQILQRFHGGYSGRLLCHHVFFRRDNLNFHYWLEQFVAADMASRNAARAAISANTDESTSWLAPSTSRFEINDWKPCHYSGIFCLDYTFFHTRYEFLEHSTNYRIRKLKPPSFKAQTYFHLNAQNLLIVFMR